MRFAVFAAVLAVVGCSRPSDEREKAVSTPATKPKAQPQPHKTGAERLSSAVVFQPESGEPARVSVELARTEKQIRTGLMYREHLPPDMGMLFLFHDETIRTFWMKNTLVPLDMIFVTSDMVVAGVVENAEPRTLESRKVDAPTQFVVEVNAGWAAKHGVGAGTHVTFEGVDDVPPKPTASQPE